MRKHIIIVAIRNLLKYRQQTIISIVGLAIGFVCFALSAYWIRYEMNFDAFHKNADRIYQVRPIDKASGKVKRASTAQALAPAIEKQFPETKTCYTIIQHYYFDSVKTQPYFAKGLLINKNFFEVFDIAMLSGTFNENNPNSVVITESLAKKYFNTSNPVGKELTNYANGNAIDKYIITGVVKDWPQNTNLPFQLLRPFDNNNNSNWSIFGVDGYCLTYVLLNPKVDIHSFKEKFAKWQLKEILNAPSFQLIPIQKVYYTEPISERDFNLKFEQVLLFAGLGLLVILCALFNYLNLYASRMRMRIKELFLRKTNGASNNNLFTLLATEFIILLTIACIIGLIGIECCLPAFKEFASIQSDQILIYLELGMYITVLIGISLLMVAAVIHYTRRHLLREAIHKTSQKHGSFFGRLSTLLQMIISLGFIFCTTVYFKQIYTLGNADPGYKRENLMQVYTHHQYTDYYDRSEIRKQVELNNEIATEIKKIPYVKEIISTNSSASICPRYSFSGGLVLTEDMRKEDAVEYEDFRCPPEFISFYELHLTGENFKPESLNNGRNVIINEATAKALNLKDPIGKTILEMAKPFYDTDGTTIEYPEVTQYNVIGIVKDFLFESPLTKVRPIIMSRSSSIGDHFGIKYQPGFYKETAEAIQTMINEKFEQRQVEIYNMDEIYRTKYAKEASLRLLLALLSAVCIVISLFGIYSVVALHTEYRRKEIAVRKVNGASLRSIFGLFFKEYIVLLTIAATIAFPIGYLFIKPWTEQYILQTTINWWLYPLLFTGVAIIILLTITARVWHTAHINPATELKKE